jgi:hypothetical protein
MRHNRCAESTDPRDGSRGVKYTSSFSRASLFNNMYNSRSPSPSFSSASTHDSALQWLDPPERRDVRLEQRLAKVKDGFPPKQRMRPLRSPPHERDSAGKGARR